MFWDIAVLVAERVKTNFMLLSEAVPNALFGLALAVIVWRLLEWHKVRDPEYLSFDTAGRRTFLFFSFLTGVIFISPLPIGKLEELVVLLSAGILLVVFAVTSYMDIYTHKFYKGYVMVGMGAEIILLILSAFSGRLNLIESEAVGLICCVIFNWFSGSVSIKGWKHYSRLDMWLFYMALICFVISDCTYAVFAFCCCEFVATMFCVVMNALFAVKSATKVFAGEGHLKDIKFPFTAFIFIGYLSSMFLIGK